MLSSTTPSRLSTSRMMPLPAHPGAMPPPAGSPTGSQNAVTVPSQNRCSDGRTAAMRLHRIMLAWCWGLGCTGIIRPHNGHRPAATAARPGPIRCAPGACRPTDPRRRRCTATRAPRATGVQALCTTPPVHSPTRACAHAPRRAPTAHTGQPVRQPALPVRLALVVGPGTPDWPRRSRRPADPPALRTADAPGRGAERSEAGPRTGARRTRSARRRTPRRTALETVKKVRDSTPARRRKRALSTPRQTPYATPCAAPHRGEGLAAIGPAHPG